MREKILNVPFDVLDKESALKRAEGFLAGAEPRFVVTPNPEFVVRANSDEKFMRLLQKTDLNLVDGIGIVLASKIKAGKIKERVSGCDFVESLLGRVKRKKPRVFLLGGKPNVAEKAGEYLKNKYIGVNIVGAQSGYFDEKDELLIVKSIKKAQPDILLVGMSSPRQEFFIEKYLNIIPAKIFIACGGSLDVYSGEVRRAPKVLQKWGLEWLYRLLKEPKRFFRFLSLPKFLMMVVFSKKDRG